MVRRVVVRSERDSEVPRPSAIDVHRDGRAIACFDGEPLLEYPTLAEALARHSLTSDDLVEP